MYPKLNHGPVLVDFNQRMYCLPRNRIAAAYAGATAAKECLLWELSGFLIGTQTSFIEQYDKAYPACIVAANQIGLSATVETLDYHNPGNSLNYFIKEKMEHSDNPFYPFFEED